MSNQKLSTAQSIMYNAVKQINDLGITVAVASDPEGNNFNELKAQHMFWHDENKKGFMPLAVWGTIEEDKIFLEE